jgi:hypothetical protein
MMRKSLPRLMALLLTALLVLAFAACGNQAAETAGTPDSTADTTAFALSEETTTEAPAATEAPTTTEAATTTEEATTVAELDTAAVLKLFNDATKKAADENPGYEKHRTTVTKMDMSPFGVLSSLGLEKAVNDYLRVDSNGNGQLDLAVAKGEDAPYISASTLKASHVNSAAAVPTEDGGYEITISVKSGSTNWSGEGGRTYEENRSDIIGHGNAGGDPGSGNDKAPLDYGPLFKGINNDGDFDHKRPQGYYYKINNAGIPGLLVTDASDKTSNVKFTATVDKDGKLTALKGVFDLSVTLKGVKFLLTSFPDAVGSGRIEVTFTNFVW